MKTEMLNRETENSQRFMEDLVSSLLNYRKAIFQTGDSTITVKFADINKKKNSASECFMATIINAQNQKIVNLKTKCEELSIMMNTIQLFANVS